MICFVDVETDGLEERGGHLLEVALVVTTDELVEVDHYSALVKPVLAGSFDSFVRGIDPVVYTMHEQSGLLREVEALGPGNLPGAVEARVVEWLVDRVAEYGARADNDAGALEPRAVLAATPLAGSTVGFDRRWLRAHMPSVEALFHYRSIDVSSINEIARRWAPAIYEDRPKAGKAHRALADARESIENLRYYRRCGFIGGGA